MENKEKTGSVCPEKTLIVNYRGLQIGGIETFLAKLIKYSTEKGYRVIWMTTPKNVEKCDFKDIVNHPLVEKVFIKGKSHRWLPHKRIRFQDGECVTMITMEPLNYMKAEKIRAYAKNVKRFDHFLALPHFTGIAYYPERTFKSKLLREHFGKYMKKNIETWLKEDCIRAYSMKHLDFYEKNYGITIENKEEKILQKINLIKDFDEEFFKNKASERKNNFTIVTCARFDFPHKGYMLGLLDDYKELKEKYSQLKLVIIGYGSGEKRIKEKLEAMTEAQRQDVELVGAVSPFDLSKYFEKGHLNVGLAGALFDGAICALPSVCVRHYSEECQTYGHISDMTGTYLRSDEGEAIKPYIERLINMSDEEYISITKRDFERARLLKTNNPQYIFDQRTKTGKCTITGFNAIRARLFNLMEEATRVLRKTRACEEDITEKK